MQPQGGGVNRADPMTKEIEAKFRLSDPVLLRERLRTLDAVWSGRVFETNRIFDTPDRRLRNADCGLRVRQWRSLDTDGRAGSTLTFKGPREAGDLKSREEIETPVTDGAATVTILQRVGFEVVVIYEKRRETWRLGECEVTIDELPRLGWYAEIEGPDPAGVQSARTELGLADTPLVHESYVHLTATHGARDEHGRRNLLFTAASGTA